MNRVRSDRVGPGGDRRTVTVTFGYGDRLRSLVAGNLRHALILAEARWGRWTTIESVSTPDTIYSDLIGRTADNHTPGAMGAGAKTTASKLRAIGYEPAPGEVATLRYFRADLPRTYRHTKRPSKGTPTAYDDEFGTEAHD
jgi:hypothetical protein